MAEQVGQHSILVYPIAWYGADGLNQQPKDGLQAAVVDITTFIILPTVEARGRGTKIPLSNALILATLCGKQICRPAKCMLSATEPYGRAPMTVLTGLLKATLALLLLGTKR